MWQAALTSTEALKSPRKRPIKRRGRILSFSARGAEPQTRHGPLQRLLEVTITANHCARAASTPQPEAT